MAQVSYGTITITDTTDIEDVFLIYKGSSSNTTAPSIVWSGSTNDWKTDITQVTGDYIWAITVFKRTGITITSSNYTDYYSDPVCLTGEPGTSITITSIKYSTATTQAQPADNTFTLNSPPTVPEGGWLWSRTLFSSGQSVYSKAKQGEDGVSPTVSKTGDTVTITDAEGNTVTVTDGANGQSYYTYIRYSVNSNGSGMVETPTANTKYIGVYSGTSSTVPAYTEFDWSKYVGENGDTGPQGVSVTAVRELYYLTTGNAPDTPTTQTTIYDDDRVGAWTPVVPEYIVNGNYYISLETTLSNSSKVWSDVVLDQALTDANYNAYLSQSLAQHANENANGALSIASSTQVAQEALQSKLRKIWINETTSGSYVAGTYAASGLNQNPDNFDITNPSTYGFNSLLRHTYLSFRYNTHQLVTIGTGITTDTGGISGIAINSPIVNNSNQITGVIKGLELTSTELKFYEPNISGTQQVDAQLDANGLKLLKGGIEAGNPGNNNFIYLSTNNYPLRRFISSENSSFDSNKQYYIFEDNQYVLVENPVAAEISNYYEISVEGVVINGYTPTEGLSDTGWRQIIGDKFGVDGEGNLYAGNAHISGSIEVNADSNVYDIQTINDVIYGVVTYIYNNNGQEEEVYKREDGTYYWIEINNNIEIIHEIEESELQKDAENNLLIIRKTDGIDTTVNNITTQLNNAQESINSLRSVTIERIDNLAGDNNTINNNLTQYDRRLNDLEGYIIIDSEHGFIKVGGQNSRSYVKIDGVNAMVSINTKKKEKIAYISEDRFYAPSAVVTNLFMQREGTEGLGAIGEIGWVMRSNGHLSLKRIK